MNTLQAQKARLLAELQQAQNKLSTLKKVSTTHLTSYAELQDTVTRNQHLIEMIDTHTQESRVYRDTKKVL